MGAEAAALGGMGLGVGTALLGARETRKGRKAAEREAGIQREHQAQQETLYKAEQAKASERQARLQESVNKGIARGNRRRIRGGIFGDAEPTQGITRSTLG